MYPEIVRDSNAILSVADHHDYVKELLDNGHNLRDIIALVSTTDQWNSYVRYVKNWINNRRVVHQTNMIG